MDYKELTDLVFTVAAEHIRQGPGWAQQGAVLEAVASRVPNYRDQEVQQRILTCWHDLFREGRLSWGYNLDNPDAPFYHIPVRETTRERLRR